MEKNEIATYQLQNTESYQKPYWLDGIISLTIICLTREPKARIHLAAGKYRFYKVAP